jgi:hypothetical protein
MIQIVELNTGQQKRSSGAYKYGRGIRSVQDVISASD